MSPTESKYVENKAYLARLAREARLGARENWLRQATEFLPEEQWFRHVKQDFPKYVPFLMKQCELEFRGRILEIGAGGAWLSAELSKLPRVVAIMATDLSPYPLKEYAPRVFELRHAHARKITRMASDFHRLDFPDHYFDYVVCSSVLHRATNIVLALREAKRVLKSGGQLVVIREPVWPLVRIKSRARILAKLLATGINDHFYTLSDYREFFKQAALPMQAQKVNLSRGFKYYVDSVVNGLTHARYAFIGTRRGRSS